MRIPREQIWPTERAAARAALKAWRADLSNTERAAMDGPLAAAIEQRLIGWLAAAQIARPVLAVYWAIRSEPNLSARFSAWREMGFELALPVTPDVPDPLQFARWHEGDDMIMDRMKIQSPAQRTWVQPHVILVPCLGYSGTGYRLGYGGGYYDRTLLNFHGLSLGVAYSACELTEFTPQPHDIALNEIVTEA